MCELISVDDLDLVFNAGMYFCEECGEYVDEPCEDEEDEAR